jgi:hypothetical protein
MLNHNTKVVNKYIKHVIIITIYLSSVPTVLEALHYWLKSKCHGGSSSTFDAYLKLFCCIKPEFV